MKPLTFFALLWGSLSSAAPYHGNFLICSNEDNTLKMTADLSDGKGEKVAVAVSDGKKSLFQEASGGRNLNTFYFYPSKKMPLLVKSVRKNETEISVTVDPGHEDFQLVLDRKEPVLYRVAKYNAFLSVRNLKVQESPVSCTETKWENN